MNALQDLCGSREIHFDRGKSDFVVPGGTQVVHNPDMTQKATSGRTGGRERANAFLKPKQHHDIL